MSLNDSSPHPVARARNVYRAFDRWLQDPVPVHPMLLSRIGLGSILFLAYLSRLPLVETLWGPSGYAGYEYRQRFPEATNVGWYLHSRFDVLTNIASGELIWALYFTLLLCAALFALGIRPKITGSILLVLHVLFLDRNPGATWGWSTMMKPFLLYTVCAARADHWSIRHWWQARRGQPVDAISWTMSAWPLRLLQLHVLCVFMVVGTRFEEGSWLAGQGLAAAMVNRDWARLDVDWFPYFDWLKLPGLGAFVLEGLAPAALLIRPLRTPWTLALIAMFVTLVLTTSVGWWDCMMIVVLCTFLPQTWLERAFKVWRR